MHSQQSTTHSPGQQLTAKMSHWKLQLRCMSTPILVQMKLKKVIDNVKNIPNKGFEQSEEL
jgi:hypothetical protein